MINVDTLYSRIKDLARKDKGGYLDPEEYNRNLVDSQTLLFEWYAQNLEQGQDVPSNMRQFIERTNLLVSSDGLVTLPDDFRYVVRVNWRRVTNVPGGEPVVSKYPALPIARSEVNVILQNKVRQPNILKSRIFYSPEGDYLHVWPEEAGSIELEYLRNPVTPYRATTLDSTNDEYNYTSVGSTQLEWPENQQPDFVDLLLFHYGLPTRQTEIIQWVASKKGITQQL